jgi:hypothetical protein
MVSLPVEVGGSISTWKDTTPPTFHVGGLNRLDSRFERLKRKEDDEFTSSTIKIAYYWIFLV